MINDILKCKTDIKNAIEMQIPLTGGMTTYADAIKQLTYQVYDMKISNGTKFSYSKFVFFPQGIDTSDITDMSDMFNACNSLKIIPQLNTSNVTHMGNMFCNCSKLTTIPLLDTSKVTDMSSMFTQCYSLTSIPQLDTSNVNSMFQMFYNCHSLTSIPQLNTSNVTNMNGMFCFCEKLTSIPQLDTSKVTNMNGMFYECTNLTDLPLLDCSNVIDFDSICGGCTSLSNVSGFKNLGKIRDITSRFRDDFSDCPLTRQSCINIFNNLYDRASAGYSVLKLYFLSSVINNLSDEDIAIATNKGWTIEAY